MRILLVQPAPFEEGRLGLENIMWLSEPVALTAVAASVAHHDVQILDLRLEPENALAHTLSRFLPDVVGTTSMTTDAYQAKAVLRTAKTMLPDCLTLIGGHHPTLSPHEFHEPFIDVIVKGEGEITFGEIIAAHHEVVRSEQAKRAASGASEGGREGYARAGPADRSEITGEHAGRILDRTRAKLCQIDGIRFQTSGGEWMETDKREQQRSLDSLPAPNRSLVSKYRGQYFFTVAQPMASIFTSRGCSFDCNFCAIWEFYERRTRYLSAEKIADQMAACDEPYVFLLDDNFLTDQKRLHRLVEVLRERKIEKFWMTQGRTDFIAQHPDLMKDLASVGLMCVLSGFESNDDNALASLKKTNTAGNNLKAMEVLRQNGIQSTGIFMARTDFEAKDFAELYDYINALGIVAPIVTIHTPLPGTQLERKMQDRLLTKDRRFYDLLHAVVETKLPRAEFYRHFSQQLWATMPSTLKALGWQQVMKRKDFWWSVLPNIPRFVWNARRNRIVHSDPRSYLADEAGILDGKAETRWSEAKPAKPIGRKLPVLAS